MKHLTNYSIAIFLILLSVCGLFALPYIRSMQNAGITPTGITFDLSWPGTRQPYPEIWFVMIPFSVIAVMFAILTVTSILLGAACCWIFGSQSSN